MKLARPLFIDASDVIDPYEELVWKRRKKEEEIEFQYELKTT